MHMYLTHAHTWTWFENFHGSIAGRKIIKFFLSLFQETFVTKMRQRRYNEFPLKNHIKEVLIEILYKNWQQRKWIWISHPCDECLERVEHFLSSIWSWHFGFFPNLLYDNTSFLWQFNHPRGRGRRSPSSPPPSVDGGVAVVACLRCCYWLVWNQPYRWHFDPRVRQINHIHSKYVIHLLHEEQNLFSLFNLSASFEQSLMRTIY